MSPGAQRLILASTVLALLWTLSACQPAVAPQSEAPPTNMSDPVAGQPLQGDGPGISVADALKPGLSGPLLVNGFVVADGASVRLCDALAESSPPQCGGASMPVRGFDLATLAGAQHAGEVTWSDMSVQLLGEVQNGVLAVSPNSQG